MSRIVNESTSIVQIDSSGLQNGQVNVVFISTTTIPGQIVTVIDATGFTSSPQSILLSTTGGAQFSDATSSVSIRQRFGYITLHSESSGSSWTVINSAAFSNPTSANSYKGLDTGTVNAYLTNTTGLLSTTALATRSLAAEAGGIITERVYTSTMYVNTISSFLASRPGDYRMTIAGNEHINGAILVSGTGSYRGSISTGGNLFSIGNISSKLGVIYIGGDVRVGGTIRGQRGNLMSAETMSIFTSSGFLGPVTVHSTVTSGNFVQAASITTPDTTGESMNVMSSIIFATAFQSMRNTPMGIEVIGVSATIPSSLSTSWITASNSIQTSNISLRSFGSASTLQFLTLGSTVMTNDNGALTTSSIQVRRGLINQEMYSKSVQNSATLFTQGIRMNDANASSDMQISFSGTTYDISGYWMISSTGTRGTLNAPFTAMSSFTTLTRDGAANTLNTNTDTVTKFITSQVTASNSVHLTGCSTASLRNVFINNSLGSITGSHTGTTQEIYCSSIITEQLSVGGAMRFLTPVTARLQDTFISTVTSGSVRTSSLHTTQITTGIPQPYSTVNQSTPWLLTSSFNMNTDPFMETKGLGTYFDEVTFVASKNQTTYYSIVNPDAQTKIYLSTPYINRIAGTGIPGTVINGQQAVRASLGTEMSKVATDSSGTIFVGTKDLGWKIHKISPTGTISTIAGNYRYFYGDGQIPTAAAFSPRLAVSVSPQSKIVITDISNVRLRILTVDPIVATIAGTGDSSYSGDGGLAYLATLSTPTATTTDSSGNIYVADTRNQVIRRITDSTITTYAGTPGLTGNTGDGGPATAARLNTPFGLVTDLSNNMYFTDLSNCAIRKITPQGTISLVAGTYAPGFGGDGGLATAATLSTPRGITIDANNNIYFCDTGNSRVRRIDATTNVIQTVAGTGVSGYGGDGGLAVNAKLSTPTGIAADSLGNLYIADTNNQCIRYLNMTNSRIATVAGQPMRQGYGGDYSFATFALLNSPSHVAVDRNSGYYYIADDGNSRIRYVEPVPRIINTIAGNGSPLFTGDGGAASAAVFGSIKCLTRDSANNLYIVDDAAHVVRMIDLTTGNISRVAGTGVAGFSGEGGLAVSARLSSPQVVVIDSNADLYLTDRDNQRVRKITTGTGLISTIVGTGVAGYNGDSISSIAARLSTPTALAIDPVMQTLYIGDLNNNRIRAVNESSMILTYAGSGDYGAPTVGASFASTMLASTTSIAIGADSQVYFTEVVTNGMWKLNTLTGTLEATTLLSTSGGYLGDAGPLSNAYLSTPMGLTTDGSGNFLIADQGNSRLRGTYTYGYPQTPVYLTLNFNYTNYFASTGTATIALNGTTLKTFYGSNESNDSYQITNANIYSYPLQGTNPVYDDQTPYVEITQTDANGYTKLDGILYVQEVPSQGLLQNSVNSNTGIIMNSGILRFPHVNNGITIDNRFNDVSTRNVLYTGQLRNASDPVLKEKVEIANSLLCYSTLAQVPLKRYKYIDPYISTFHVKDIHRLGFLTTDVIPVFPKSVHPLGNEEHSWISSSMSIDTSQIKYAHYGVTQHLIGLVSTLEAEVRSLVAQRNTIL